MLPVRRSDPATSWEAARRLPIRVRQAEVLLALREMGVSACAAQIKGWLLAKGLLRERNEVASRLSELHRAGLVRKDSVKKGARGRPVQTWTLTHEGRVMAHQAEESGNRVQSHDEAAAARMTEAKEVDHG